MFRPKNIFRYPTVSLLDEGEAAGGETRAIFHIRGLVCSL